MRAAALLLPATLLSVPAGAVPAPDAAALMRRVMPAEFGPVLLQEPIVVPVPKGQLVLAQGQPGPQVVALPPLLDRHLRETESFSDVSGMTLIAGTLDFKKNGYVSVLVPGAVDPMLFKLERHMGETWSTPQRNYRIDLDVNIFRDKFNNVIQIKDASTGEVVWAMRIGELFHRTYLKGEPVLIGGRTYRLFLCHAPDGRKPSAPTPELGLAFIYEDTSQGGRDYQFYVLHVSEFIEPNAASYNLFENDKVSLQASADLATLTIDP